MPRGIKGSGPHSKYRVPAKEVGEREPDAVNQDLATNGAKVRIDASVPYVASVTIKGVADILFHRWNVEEVESKAAARKGSEQKRTDNVESMLYRDEDGLVCLPGEYLAAAMRDTARFLQDPRSPRKSLRDLAKAAIVPLSILAPIRLASTGKYTKAADYIDKRRVMVQRNAVNRSRPAFRAGWECDVDLLVTTPEYLPPAKLHELLEMTGRLNGIAEIRPTYGRFRVVRFETKTE